MEKTGRLLTIGQFAALHGINKKTLMWYDEIGLFRPAFTHPENGYRYYSYYQSSVLETILLLRELDVSVGEIRAFMENRSAASLERLLGEKIGELDRSIRRLREIRRTLVSRRQTMRTLLSMDVSGIYVVEKEERGLVAVDISREDSFDRQVELITAETQRRGLRRLHDASYGTMIAVEHLYSGEFEAYSKLFIDIPAPAKKAGLHMQPGGRYIRAFYTGPWEELPRRYGEILDFAQENRLTLFGFSYEIVLNETVIDRVEDSIVQIEIPVRETGGEGG